MSIVLVEVEGGIVQSVSSDDDDVQVIVIDRDNDTSPNVIEKFVEVGVEPEWVGATWKRVSEAGGRIERQEG